MFARRWAAGLGSAVIAGAAMLAQQQAELTQLQRWHHSQQHHGMHG